MKNKMICAAILIGLLIWSIPAFANLKMIKAYKEAFPEAALSKPVCLNCHVDEKPKKDDGQHEWNDYGKAVKAIAASPTADDFKKLGTIEDFSKKK